MATATGSKDIDIAGTAARLAALGPHDALGAMLAEQMAAVHAAALRALERAGACKDQPQIEALYLRLAARRSGSVDVT